MNRDNILHFRVSDLELRVLKLMSEREGVKPSEMTRMLIREGAEKRHVVVVTKIDNTDISSVEVDKNW